MANISLYLQYARIAQYESASKNRKDSVFKGGVIITDYSRLLYILQTQIGKRFALLPSDPSLTATSEYMYSLSGTRIINTTPIATPLIITVNPQSQTVNVGTVVTFTVAATGGTLSYTYQWIYNGTPIGGATNSSLTINPTVLGSAGAYDCIVQDVNGQTVTSAIANLVVNSAALVASWYWNATVDPYPNLSIGIDNLTYLGTVNFITGSPIVIPWPSGSANNTYKVVRYPIGEGAKVHFFNNDLNQGSIPGVAYNEIVTIGSFLYIISKGDSIFTPFIVTYT